MPVPIQLFEMPDNAPIYRETTDLSHFIVEPWNAFSSLTFLIPALIFIWQLRKEYRHYAFFVFFCSPLLIVGGLGSTLFHAFRSSGWLLLMDVMPILLLVLGISVWMWWKLLKKWWMVVLIIGIFFLATFVVRRFLQGQDAITAGYIIRGTMLLLPCFLFLFKTEFRHGWHFALALLSFVLAVTFRFLDEKIELSFMPWGTHWLWHVSTAAGAYFLGEYLIGNVDDPGLKDDTGLIDQ